MNNLYKATHQASSGSFRDFRDTSGGAIAGVHSMTDEHFGTSIMEYIAAGAVAIAHNSGGPKINIVFNMKMDKDWVSSHKCR